MPGQRINWDKDNASRHLRKGVQNNYFQGREREEDIKRRFLSYNAAILLRGVKYLTLPEFVRKAVWKDKKTREFYKNGGKTKRWKGTSRKKVTLAEKA